MKEKMVPVLAEYFKNNGLMSRDEYRNQRNTPFTVKEIERAFSKYHIMVHEVSLYTPPAPVVIPKPSVKSKTVARKPYTKKVITASQEVKKELSENQSDSDEEKS